MLQAAALSAFADIRHAFFTRQGGVSEGVYASLNAGIGSDDDPAKVAENRARMAAALGVAAKYLLTPYQVHSCKAVVVDTPWEVEERPRADALVTTRPGLAIAITTADCGPVLLADHAAHVIAAAHAGWRGAAAGVLEATVEAMEACGADRKRIVAALGPMIRQPSYEVGPELVKAFTSEESGNERFFKYAARQGHALFDLASYITARLLRLNIQRVEDLGHCTYSDPVRFFSYRRSTHSGESDYGRHISAIALFN